jgi:tetratricopeptide (TPR) repeat protein/predicted Ser/Thr protein kinase
MHLERWEQIKHTLLSALALEEPERREFVLQTCGDDADLEREVRSLLDAHARSTGWLENPAPSELGITGWLGGYRVIHEAARGGMGAVYLAELGETRVAVKIVDQRGEEAIRRFHRERAILAALNHPNIAQLLDWGETSDGRPYFVMEWVEGAPIDRYCEEGELPVARRLGLFLEVCSAVHAAHQKFVIHRDLKPANILVAGNGAPKLLDFGIAKLTDGCQHERTRTGFRFLTLEYSSPEQMRGEAVTTASDIYSLGAVLYAMLAGRAPHELDGLAPHEAARVVCEVEPAPPSRSAGRRQLAGDLDAIVMRALSREPEERYASVPEFAEDIHRFLTRLPVEAGKRSLRKRVGRLVRRRRRMLLGTIIAAAVLAGSAWSALRETRLTHERALAVRTLAGSLLHEVDREVARPLAQREAAAQRALDALNALAAEAGSGSGMEQDLASAYMRIARMQGDLGRGDAALDSWQKAQKLMEGAHSAGARRNLATIHLEMAKLLRAQGRTREAAAHYADLRTLMPVLTEKERAEALHQNGELLVETGDYRGARDRLKLAAESYVKAAPGADSPHDLGVQLLATGKQLLAIGERGEGRHVIQQAAALLEVVSRGDRSGAASYTLGEARAALGDTRGALNCFREALAKSRPQAASDPTDRPAVRRMADSRLQVGRLLGESGHPAEALKYFRSAGASYAGLLLSGEPDRGSERLALVCRTNAARMLMKLKQPGAALSEFRRILGLAEALAERAPGDLQVRRDLGFAYLHVGDTLAAMGEWVGAADHYGKSLGIREELCRAHPGNPELRADAARAGSALAEARGHLRR